MKTQKLFASLALTIFLTACASNSNQNSVSEETISQALDGQVNIGQEQVDQTNTTEEKSTKRVKNVDENGIDYDMWRDMIVEIGDFSPTLAKNITEEQLKELILNARQVAEITGYWDVKDFVFQDLGKTFPELSNKFPLDSIELRYNQLAANPGEYNGQYDYERQLMIDLGYPSSSVWAIDDKTVEDAFHEAYEEDEELYYEDYVAGAAEILFGANEAEDTEEDEQASDTQVGSEPASNNKASSNNTKKNKLRRYGSSQTDYDAIKSALVQYYEFSPASVNQMTNEDIDIAYTRAMNRLEETGFGDIGLIFQELGKMYPGASTMYPGTETENN